MQSAFGRPKENKGIVLFMIDAYILVQALVLFLGTLGGAVVPLSLPHFPKAWQSKLLAFGGSYLFSITLLHVLPELFASVPRSMYPQMGIALGIGFYMQLFLDFISHGMAHNHDDSQHSGSLRGNKSTGLLFLSLCVHAFLEGIFMGRGEGEDLLCPEASALLLFFGILLHKVPTAFSLTCLLKQQGMGQKSILASLVLFSLMSPIAWVGITYLPEVHAPLWTYLSLASGVATGSILHISATILFETDPQHNISVSKWSMILGGFLLAILLTRWI